MLLELVSGEDNAAARHDEELEDGGASTGGALVAGVARSGYVANEAIGAPTDAAPALMLPGPPLLPNEGVLGVTSKLLMS